MSRQAPFAPLIAFLAGLLVALSLAAASPAMAYPSSTPNAAWPTAKVDTQLKPRFGDLIGAGHHGYERPNWSRWRNFYWKGSCGYGDSSCQGGGYPQCDPRDPNCQGGGYPQCDPHDPYCSTASYPCSYGDPSCQQGGGYPPCDPRDPYCQQQGYYGQPQWAGGDPYGLPSIGVWEGGGYHGREHVIVDCRKDEPGRIQRALEEVADGGVIHLKGRGPACTATLQISRPVIIQGDPPAAFPTEADPGGPPVLTAPPGAPCAVIDAGPRAGVEFRDVIIEAPQGGRSACLQTFSSAVALIRTTVHYTGESSALYIQGGRLVVNDSEIDSGGYDAAIWSEDATIGMRNVGVVTASSGFDVRPGIGQTIALNHVSIVSHPGGPGGGGPMSGIIGRRGRAGDCAFVIENTYVSGFRTGMLFETGLRVEVTRSRVDQSRMGIAIDGGVLTMRGTAIDATEYGVYAYSGRGEITGGYVFSVLREPFGADPGASLTAKDLVVYSDGCRGWGRREGWLCHERHEAPSWYSRHEPGGPGRWGWNGG